VEPELAADAKAFCIIELEPVQGAVKADDQHTVGAERLEAIEAVGGGWAAHLSTSSRWLETGQTILKSKP